MPEDDKVGCDERRGANDSADDSRKLQVNMKFYATTVKKAHWIENAGSCRTSYEDHSRPAHPAVSRRPASTAVMSRNHMRYRTA